MVKTTIIARVQDGLPLAASMDEDENEDLSEYKTIAKQLFRKLNSTANDEPRCSIQSGPYVFHYLIIDNVCYLVLCDKTYPKQLAFSYLDDVHRDFSAEHGSEIASAVRPYPFVRFDTTLQRLKKEYKNARTQRNITKLNEELQQVTQVMTKNIEDVLGRGEALNQMTSISDQLKRDAEKYRKNAYQLNLQALYRKYGPPGIVLLVVLVVLYVRFWWY